LQDIRRESRITLFYWIYQNDWGLAQNRDFAVGVFGKRAGLFEQTGISDDKKNV
jgi:hypothetical protein